MSDYTTQILAPSTSPDRGQWFRRPVQIKLCPIFGDLVDVDITQIVLEKVAGYVSFIACYIS